MVYQSLKTLQELKAFFGNIGLPPELALPIGLLEVIGGIFLIVGVVTISAALFIIDMIGAKALVKLPDGFVGGYELESLLIAISVSLLLTGPGRISIEYDVLKREIFPKGKSITQKQRQMWKESNLR
jgi:putative oxidoreductase